MSRVIRTRGRVTLIAIGAVALLRLGGSAQTPPAGDAVSAFAPLATLITGAIGRQELPGAVVIVGSGDRILYKQVFGQRAVLPVPEPMTEDTIFDVASLTKVVATTTSVMQLVEQGRVRLNDPVSKFIKEFDVPDRRAITVRQLLTHTSGLPPDLPLEEEFTGAEEAIRRGAVIPLAAPADTRVIYSDINFFLLGELVARVSGERLDRYTKAHIFDPLGMRDSGFLPAESLRSRIAPTERCRPLAWPCGDPNVPFLRGIVHDPTARRMGNMAGHAGLFSTAADLSRFCRMVLNDGKLDGVRVLSPAAVERMIRPSTPATIPDVRGLGWDIDSKDSANRGDLFPVGTSFGHTGWTGTSLWLDPRTRSYVIFLSNRVHPDGKGDVTALRGEVANVAAAALSELAAH